MQCQLCVCLVDRTRPFTGAGNDTKLSICAYLEHHLTEPESFNTLLVTKLGSKFCTGSTAATKVATVPEGALLFGHPTLNEPPQVCNDK